MSEAAENAARYALRIMELKKQLGELTGNLEAADKAVARNAVLEVRLMEKKQENALIHNAWNNTIEAHASTARAAGEGEGNP